MIEDKPINPYRIVLTAGKLGKIACTRSLEGDNAYKPQLSAPINTNTKHIWKRTLVTVIYFIKRLKIKTLSDQVHLIIIGLN